VSSLTINDAGQVDYRAVINVLNWRQHPVTTTTTTTTTVAPPRPPGLTSRPGSSGRAPRPAGSALKGSDETGSSQLVQVVRADALMQDLSA